MELLSNRRVDAIRKDLESMKRSKKSSFEIACDMINFTIELYTEEIKQKNPNYSEKDILIALRERIHKKY